MSPLLSNLHVCHLPHVSYLSDEACTHSVHIDRHLFTKSPSSRSSFFDWATPVTVKPCHVVICLLIDCCLHQFLSLIQKWVRIPDQAHLRRWKTKNQVVDVRLSLLAISLATCRLDAIRKEVLRTSFSSSSATSRSLAS